MRGGGRVALRIALLAALTLIVSACLPFPRVIRGSEPTRNVFMPNVESGVAVSPLQPTRATATLPTLSVVTQTPDAVPVAETPNGLQGAIWQWTASAFSDGVTLRPDDPSRYTVEFLPDGNALAQADCNFGTGLYKTDGDRLTIGAIGATKMACPADSLDSAFLAQLVKAERFTFEGEELVLTLQDEAGEMRLTAQVSESEPTATVEPTRAQPTTAPTLTQTAVPSQTPTAAPTASPTSSPLAPTITPVLATPMPIDTPTEVEFRGIITVAFVS